MSGKQIEFYLSKTTTTNKEGEKIISFVFLPTNETLKKAKSITINAKGIDTIEDMGFPIEIRDTVVIEIGAKVIQSKLIKEEVKLPDKSEESVSS